MGKRGLSANNAKFVSVDLIGEKNQVILELWIHSAQDMDPEALTMQYTANEVVFKVYRFKTISRFFTHVSGGVV